MVKNRNIIITEVLIMKKASNIVLLVGSILGFVAAGGLFIAAVVFIILSTPAFTDFIREGIQNGSITTDASDIEIAIGIVVATFITCAVFFIIVGVLSIVSSIIALKARKEGRKGLYIACLVLGILSNEVVLVGSIFGLISNKKEPQNDVVDMTK